jgi:hypothetical protein
MSGVNGRQRCFAGCFNRGSALVRMVIANTRTMRRTIPFVYQSYSVCRSVHSIRDGGRSGRSASEINVRANRYSMGSSFSCGKMVFEVSTSRWEKDSTPARFFHWHACSHSKTRPANAGHWTIQDLFSKHSAYIPLNYTPSR